MVFFFFFCLISNQQHFLHFKLVCKKNVGMLSNVSIHFLQKFIVWVNYSHFLFLSFFCCFFPFFQFTNSFCLWYYHLTNCFMLDDSHIVNEHYFHVYLTWTYIHKMTRFDSSMVFFFHFSFPHPHLRWNPFRIWIGQLHISYCVSFAVHLIWLSFMLIISILKFIYENNVHCQKKLNECSHVRLVRVWNQKHIGDIHDYDSI